ncbi:hypothetical protein FACS1894201_03880 [Bacteroidia bacterium]|nr:hypothetical protein FACS1894201_03880 [Bacteroidia bacterium]
MLTACRKNFEIKEVVDMFSLGYGETQVRNVAGHSFSFSFTDVENRLIDCSLVDFVTPEDRYDVRLYVSLFAMIDGTDKSLKVASAPCFGYRMKSDTSDFIFLENLIASMHSDRAPAYFPRKMLELFDIGEVLTADNLRIHLAMYKGEKGVPSNEYKFIFIITKVKML